MMSLTFCWMSVTSWITPVSTNVAPSRMHGTAKGPVGRQEAAILEALLDRSVKSFATSTASIRMGAAVCTTAAVQLYTLLPVQTRDIP